MEEEERPRKLAKLDNQSQEEPAPAVTGTVGGAPADNAEPADTAMTLDKTSPAAKDEKDGGENPTEGEGAAADDNAAQPMSKSQMKKRRRQQLWEEKRGDRKQHRKDQNRARKEKRRAAIKQAKENGEEAFQELRHSYMKTKYRIKRSTLLPVTFLVDCGFDDLMDPKERISLGSQLTRAYSDNSRAPYRSHYVISSFNKQLKERFDTVLAQSHLKWRGVRILEEDDFMSAAEKAKEWMTEPNGGELAGAFADQTDAKPEDGEIVYLTSDSPDTLTELKPYSTYIVGGLVDKNRYKGICYKQAVERGLKTAKLPIGDYIQMSHRQVLATNHVVEIMINWLELKDWGQAFMKAIPLRKGGTLKASESPAPRDGGGEAEVAENEEAAVEEAVAEEAAAQEAATETVEASAEQA